MRSFSLKTFLLFFMPTFAMLFVFLYVPLVRGTVMAFQNYNLFDLTDLGFIGFENFKSIIFDKTFSFLQILGNTLTWIVFSLFFQFLLGFSLALLLKKAFRLRGVYTGLVFYTWALSGFAIGLVWSWLFNGQFGVINDILIKVGAIDTPLSFLSDKNLAMISVIVTNVWYGVPFFGIMLLAALQSVPNELYESATIDGASKFKQLFYVTIPYIKSTITTTLLLRVMWIMNFPDIIYGMTNGGPANSTNILATQMITKTIKEYDYGQSAAIGVIIMVILFTYTTIYLSTAAKSGLDI